MSLNIQYSKKNWELIRKAARDAGFPTVQAYVDHVLISTSNSPDQITAMAVDNAKAAKTLADTKAKEQAASRKQFADAQAQAEAEEKAEADKEAKGKKAAK